MTGGPNGGILGVQGKAAAFIAVHVSANNAAVLRRVRFDELVFMAIPFLSVRINSLG
mgnify:CR=1 FL=1